MSRDDCTREKAIETVQALKERTSKRNKPFKKSNPYDAGYVMRRDRCSLEEAEKKIQELKNKTSGTLANYIKRYGDEGKSRFEDFRNKSKVTEENMMRVHGKFKGREVYKNYMSSRDSMSKEFHKRKYGARWEEEYNKRLGSVAVTFEKFLKKYKDPKVAEREYSRYLLRKTRKLGFSNTRAISDESLEFFSPICEFLKSAELSYLIGTENSKEFYLWDSIHKCHRYYDFCVPKLKFVVEYHGCHHFDPDRDDYEVWRSPYGSSGYESLKSDEIKRSLLKKKGYELVEVYYRDNKKLLQDNILNRMKELIYENSQNS